MDSRQSSTQREGMPQSAPAAGKESERIVSVDVLRGFDMLWLIGGTGVALAAGMMCPEPVRGVILSQCKHVDWAGFHFYDLIFPLFVFVVGMSLVFSLGTLLEKEGRFAAYKRLLRRAALMYVLGLIYYGGMNHPIAEIRWLGVLQRLALCYLIAGILFCHLSPRTLMGVCVAALLGYWLLLCFVPLPGHTEISWKAAETWPCYIDALYLPGRKADGTWDPEGYLSTIPAVCTCLLGVFAALLLKYPQYTPARKGLLFLGIGAALVAAGWLWGLHFPVIKKIWTSSYVLVAGGYSFLLLGIFYWIVDVWRIRFWTAPLLWIGMNPITIYMARNLMDFNALAERFTGGSLAAAVGVDVAHLLQMIVSLAFSLLLLRFLYRKRIFLRL